jgi:hypothetical protein
MKYAFKMVSVGMIYLASSMKIGTGFQEILQFCLSKLRGCNVGINDGRNFVTYAVEMGSSSLRVQVI